MVTSSLMDAQEHSIDEPQNVDTSHFIDETPNIDVSHSIDVSEQMQNSSSNEGTNDFGHIIHRRLSERKERSILVSDLNAIFCNKTA